MTHRLTRRFAIALPLALVVGCSSDDSPATDTGPTPGQDAAAPGPDTAGPGPDTATPQPDTAIPEPETGPGPDTATPQPDAAPDAEAPQRDPRITSDPDPDAIACGAATCKPSKGEICCVSMLGMSCGPASSCVGLAAPAACDGPEDCGDGEHCCVGFPVGARCGAAACAGQDQELCNYDTDCASGNCTACRGPGSSLVYGLCTQGTTCPSPYTAP